MPVSQSLPAGPFTPNTGTPGPDAAALVAFLAQKGNATDGELQAAAVSQAGTAAATKFRPVADELSLGYLDLLAVQERQKALHGLRQKREDGPSFVETWADLANFTPSANAQVSAGRLFGLSGSNPGGGSRAFAIPVGGSFRLTTTVRLVAGGTSGIVGLVLTRAANGAPLPAGATASVILGFDVASAGTFAYRFTGTAGFLATGRMPELLAPATPNPALPAGDYQLTIVGDESRITVSITNNARTVLFEETNNEVNGGALTGVGYWNSDSRGLTGHSIGPITGHRSNNTGVPRVAEGAGHSTALNRSTTNNQGQRVQYPRGYDSRVPTPVVIYHHGNGELATGVYTEQVKRALIQSISDAGYIVASSDASGNNWGNEAAQTDYLDLYRHLAREAALGPVVMLGQSMGGLSSLLTVAGRKIPGIVGWAGIYPATNLRAMYDKGTYAGGIRTAYGIAADGSDYAAKTTLGGAHDPNLIDGQLFRGLPMRFWASPGDTVVEKATNTDVFAAKVALFARESTVVLCSGDHGNASHFQSADLLAFIGRCVSA